MPEIGHDLIAALQYLLPGLLCAWVYYGLTSYPEPSEFERIVQALIFTLIVQAVAFPVKELCFFVGRWRYIGAWSADGDLVLSVICAFCVGILISYCANTDRFHRALRFFNITSETSYPSEWFGTFRKNITYVVLHLNGGSRLYGWPSEWPSDPSKGHFVLEQASWLDDQNNQTDLVGVFQIMISVSDVKLVEFMALPRSQANEESIQPPAAASTTGST